MQLYIMQSIFKNLAFLIHIHIYIYIKFCETFQPSTFQSYLHEIKQTIIFITILKIYLTFE